MSRAAGLYVHIPFCSAICPYCDFAVTVGKSGARRAYVEALVAEIELAAGFPHPFDTIYFGGGTPSILEHEELERLLASISKTFRFETTPRLFFEANPEDVSDTRLASWRQLGVATLSLGVQSLDPGELAFLGRRHGPGTARTSVEVALAAGFETVSVDLIYGLPGQAPDALRRRIAAAVELGPHHLSLYELEIHERTVFGKRSARGELQPPDGDERSELFRTAHRELAKAGFTAYEVSNFARTKEHRSQHNLKYWDHTPYLGLGLGAHSFDGARRFWNERSIVRWQGRLARGERPIAGAETLGPRERALETLMLGLRTPAGIDLERFAGHFGVDLVASHRELLERWLADDLVRLDGPRLRPTLDGLAVADALSAAFDLDAVPA